MKELFENYTNYIYKVEDFGDILRFKENKYILFNPSIFKWMTIDDIGKELFEQIRSNHDINIVRDNITKKYNISEQVFEDDAMGFINQLYEEQYLSDCETEKEALWIKKEFNNYNIENYFFDDLYMSLSEVCNLKCQYCFNDKKREKRKNGESLSLDEMITVLEQYKNMGGRGVVFTGGEPTLNPNFVQICKSAKNIGLRTTVITNGTLLNKYEVSDIVQYIDGLTLSIDSTDDDIQMDLWNVNTYSYTKNVLLFLKELNEYVENNKINYPVYVMPVVNRKNIDSLHQLYHDVSEVLHNCDVKWLFSKYSSIGSEVIDKQLSITEKEYNDSLWKSFRGEISDKELLRYIMSKGGKDNLMDTPHKVTCSPAFFITFYGDIFPCQGLEECIYYLGNIRENKLEKIFYEEKFQKLIMDFQVNNLSDCKDCELKMYCSNSRGRLCIKEKDSNCKERIIQRMYLKTI